MPKMIRQLSIVLLLCSAAGVRAQEICQAPIEVSKNLTYFLDVSAPQPTKKKDSNKIGRLLNDLFLRIGGQLSLVGPEWVLISDDLHKPSDKLIVCLVKGDPSDFRTLEPFAKEWESQETWFSFSFFNGQGQVRRCKGDLSEPIRISFQTGEGSWSRTGLLDNKQTTATMNIDLNSIEAKNDLGWVIRHEFGHALGLYHEHQNPASVCDDEIDWSGQAPKVLEDKFKVKDTARIKSQFRRLVGEDFSNSDYDDESVMNYALPIDMFKFKYRQGLATPKCNNPIRKKISPDDYKGIAEFYNRNGNVRVAAQKNVFERLRVAVESSSLKRWEKDSLLAISASRYPGLSVADRQKYVDFSNEYFEINATKHQP